LEKRQLEYHEGDGRWMEVNQDHVQGNLVIGGTTFWFCYHSASSVLLSPSSSAFMVKDRISIESAAMSLFCRNVLNKNCTFQSKMAH